MIILIFDNSIHYILCYIYSYRRQHMEVYKSLVVITIWTS